MHFMPHFPRPHGHHPAHMRHEAMGRAGPGRGSGHGHHGHHGHSGDDGAGDDHGWTRGRKFGADDLQLMLLGILEKNPSHGYELIKALGGLSNGFYTPSPGMVYPALTYMEELGYATVELEGSKKRYHLSEEGRAHLDANRDRLNLLFGKLKHVARKMEWMRRAWTGQPMEAGPDGEDVATGWVPELVQARQALKQTVFRHEDADPAEQRRIAAILMRAVREIEGDA